MTLLRKILDYFLPDRGRKPEQLARWLDLPEKDLRAWLNGPPNDSFSYRRFTIPKRRGGERILDAPSDALKALQQRVLHKLLNPLSVHAAAMGFVRKRSIVNNARLHTGQAVVINLDLADFFHSISPDRVIAAWRALGWNKESARLLTAICTHQGRLPQGAPTSPALSNLVCRRLDIRLTALLRKADRFGQGRVSYSRYADDLTFSLPGFGRNKARRKKPRGVPWRSSLWPSRSLLPAIRRIIESEGFRIQKKKRVRIQRAHQRQTATGLVVNQRVNLPREVRRRMRAMQHRQRLGQLAPSQQRELAGWEALSGMVRQQAGNPGH